MTEPKQIGKDKPASPAAGNVAERAALSGPASYRWLGVAVVVTASVYAWYVFTQYERLNELNQHQLAAAGVEMKRALESAVGTFASFEPGPEEQFCDFVRDQPTLTIEGSCKRSFSKPTEVTVTTAPYLAVELKPASVRFRFQTDVVLQDLSFPESFQIIFVTNEKGEVLYQESPGQRRWMRRLRWGEQGFRDSGAGRTPGLQVENLAHAMGGEGAASWNTLSATSTRTSLQLGGVWHQVYLQPLAIQVGGAPNVVLGGAVPLHTVVREALAVDTYFTAALVFLVLIGLLGFPFVKLISLAQNERFRLRDVTLLYVSTGALLALFTYAALGLDGYSRWRGVADKGLEGLAKSLGDAYTAEVSAIRDELGHFDEMLAGMEPRDCLKWPVRHRWFESPQGTEDLPRATKRVNIEQVAWVRPGGRQMWKNTADTTGGKVMVGARPYFRAVRDRNLYQIAGRPGAPFFLTPDRSITDGKFYTFLSMPSVIPNKFCSDWGQQEGEPLDAREGAAYTAVVTAHLLSLDAPPLPSGYGFAVVNREGRVLYHSDRRLSLRENFFEELSNGARVRELMYSGLGGPLTSRYRERPHRLYLHPLDWRRVSDDTNVGVYIATFRDTSVEAALVARVFVVGLLGPILLPIAFIGCAMWLLTRASKRADRRWSVWLWAHGGLEPMYRLLTAALCTVLLIVPILYRAGVSDAVVLFMPIAATAISIWIYALFVRRCPPRRPLVSSLWHTAALVLMLVCVVIAPSTAMFGNALGREFGKLIKAEQTWMEAQRKDAVLAIEAEVRTRGYSPDAVSTLARNREAYLDLNSPSPYVGHTPAGILSGPWPVSSVALVILAIAVAAIGWWVYWNTRRFFYADLEVPVTDQIVSQDFKAAWAACNADERHMLLQVTREHIANPYQRPVITKLLQRGLLRLDPDLRPFSEEFERFLLRQESKHGNALQAWERVEVSHSWHYTRMVLFASVGSLAFFLVATQPALQSGLLGIATGITGAVTASLKVRDTVASFMENRKTTT